MPPATLYTFTHGDLSTDNILIKDGNISGIIDWEPRGYFPTRWEWTATKACQSDHDREWKTLLQKHMDEHVDAHEFWSDYYALSIYPSFNERRRESLLKELEGKEERGCYRSAKAASSRLWRCIKSENERLPVN